MFSIVCGCFFPPPDFLFVIYSYWYASLIKLITNFMYLIIYFIYLWHHQFDHQSDQWIGNHSNICDSLRAKTHRRMEYFVTLIDDYTRYGYTYLLKHKSKVVKKFRHYKLEVEKQQGEPIKSVNNDISGEVEAFDEFCKEEGIRQIYIMPYKP